MNSKGITLIYFSPTGTTQKVLENITKGMGREVSSRIDITDPATRNQAPPALKDEMVLMGAPVYAGRIPKDAADYFKTLKGNGTPVVLTVVYGNREFEDALLELKNITSENGFIPVAGAAFIGEHSFSNDEFPIAVNRPDKEDLELACEFGKQISDMSLDQTGTLKDLKVPGNHPYKDGMGPKAFPFISISEDCDNCGTCVSVCPKEAIDEDRGYITIDDRCIFCCACIKACPQNARSLMDGPMKDTAKRLHENCSASKAPQTFFAGQA